MNCTTTILHVSHQIDFVILYWIIENKISILIGHSFRNAINDKKYLTGQLFYRLYSWVRNWHKYLTGQYFFDYILGVIQKWNIGYS